MTTIHKTNPVIFNMPSCPKGKKGRKRFARMIEDYVSGRSQRPKSLGGKGYKNRTYLDYVTRDDAAFNLDISVEESRDLIFLKKNMPEEYSNRINELKNTTNKTTGLYGKNGLMDKDEVDDIKDKMLKIDGNKQWFWQTIVSFSNSFTEYAGVFHPDIIHQAVKDRVMTLFKGEGIEEEDMEWMFGFHIDTDNPHIHLGIFENNQTSKNEKFRSKYNFTQENINSFKFELARDIILTSKNFDVKCLNQSRNNIMRDFKIRLQNNDIIESPTWREVRNMYKDISKGYYSLYNEVNSVKGQFVDQRTQKAKTYKDLSPEGKEKMNELIDKLFLEDQTMSEEIQLYKENLKIYQEATNVANGFDPKDNDNFINSSLYSDDGLYARLGSKILKSLKNADNVSKITDTPKRHNSMSYKIKPNIFNMMIWALRKSVNRDNKVLSGLISSTNKKMYQLNNSNKNKRR